MHAFWSRPNDVDWINFKFRKSYGKENKKKNSNLTPTQAHVKIRTSLVLVYKGVLSQILL